MEIPIQEIIFFDELTVAERKELISWIQGEKESLKRFCRRKIGQEGPNFVLQSFFLFLLSLSNKKESQIEKELSFLSQAVQRKNYS